MNPVVGGAGLLAQHGHLGIAQAGFGQCFEEFVAHHSVADDDDLHGFLADEEPPSSQTEKVRHLGRTPARALEPSLE